MSGVKLWGYLVSLSQRVNPSHTFLLSFLVGRDKLSTPLGWRRRDFCGGRLLPRGGSTSVRAPENCRDHYDVRLTPESVTVGVRTKKSPGGHVLHSVLTSPHLISVMVSIFGRTSLGFRPGFTSDTGIRHHRNEIIMQAVWGVRSSTNRSKIRGSGMNLVL